MWENVKPESAAHIMTHTKGSEGKTCSVEGCPGKHYGRGYCKKHYARVWRHGYPEKKDVKGVNSPHYKNFIKVGDGYQAVPNIRLRSKLNAKT